MDESENITDRISMGWKLEKDSKTGSLEWRIADITMIDKERKKEIRNLSLQQAIKKRNELCIEEKKMWLIKHLEKHRVPFVDDREIIVINRENLAQESYDAFQSMIDLNLHKELQIFFVGEKAQDAGGVEREWLTQLVASLLSPEMGFFKRQTGLSEPTYFFEIKKDEQTKQLQWYYFLGQLVGKALFDSIPIYFPVCKFILQLMIDKEYKFDVEDLKYFDSQIYRSIKMIRDTELSQQDLDILQLNFQIDIYDQKGELIQQHDLIPNAKNVQVTNENKQKFIDLYLEYILRKSVSKQLEKFLSGFYSVVDSSILQIFEAKEELEFILEGSPIICLDDWKDNTIYKDSLSSNHELIVWFWTILEELSQEELRTFLQFSTGSTRVPIEGFKGLISNRGKIQKFTIMKYNDPEVFNSSPRKDNKDSSSSRYVSKCLNFIKAQTCFNRILIPKFSSKEEMKQNIQEIISNKSQWLYFDLE